MNTLKLLALRLKAQRPLLPLLLVVVAFQLILGQASAYVLAEREPPLNIAVQQLGDSALSQELATSLADTKSLGVVEVDATLSPDEVFRNNHVQGLLVIPADFGQRIEAGRKSPVLLYSAPGITNREYATEQISNTIMRLRARNDLTVALEKLGEPNVLTGDIPSRDLLEVVYEGPGLQSNPQQTAPVYGVSALLVLLAFLHAALTVPTHADKRLLACGRRAYQRQMGASLAAVCLIWLVVIGLYFLFMTVSLGTAPPLPTCLGFIVLMLYVSTLAALLAQLLGSQAATWVFLPLFILNMTIGGGLWGKVAVSPLLAPLVPVAAVVTPGSATLLGTATLAVATLGALAALLVTMRLKVAEGVR